MSDPRRLLDQASDAEARLLSSALDEPPPPHLLDRTLDAVTAATAAGAVTVTAAAAAKAGAGAGVVAGGGAAGGGILAAIGIGALAGLLAVGAYQVATSPGEAVAPAPPPPALVRAADPPAPRPERAAEPPLPAPTASAAPSASAAPAASGVSALATELGLLDEARAALAAGDAARARALLDRHAREIPRPQLTREAALLRAEARAAADGGAKNRGSNP
jgi:hypothetical protein